MKTKPHHTPLLHTKLHRPPVSADHLHEPWLLDRLNKGRHQPVILVSAPDAVTKTALPQLNLVMVILAAMTTGQLATGEQQFTQMFVVALTIAVGLLIGNTIIQPKTTLSNRNLPWRNIL